MFLNLQSLASAIAATKVLSAQQVVKNEAGEEVRSGHRAHTGTVTVVESKPRIVGEI